MTRFLTQQVVPMGGKTVTVMTRPSGDLATLAAAAPHILAEARTLLRRTNAQLSGRISERVVRVAKYFFLTDPFAIAKGDVATIKAVLGQIANGLAGDVTIKVGSTVGRNDKQVRGVVAKSTNLVPGKPYHNVVADLDTGAMKKAGAIRIDENRFMSDNGVKTFIHEASHKYAGTIDYCYFKDADMTPRSTFDDKSQALINADSYAWFVMYVGSEWDSHF